MLLIAIAGASGSGKTTLASQLHQHLGPERCALIAVDSYYRDLNHLSPAERELVNFDHPASLDSELLIDHLRALSGNLAVEIPVYNFSEHRRIERTLPQPPAPIVILEGIYALYWSEIRDLATHRIFIDTPLDLCLERRIKRDQSERGRTAESVVEQWSKNVIPMFTEHALGTTGFASLRLAGNGDLNGSITQILGLLGHLPGS